MKTNKKVSSWKKLRSVPQRATVGRLKSQTVPNSPLQQLPGLQCQYLEVRNTELKI